MIKLTKLNNQHFLLNPDLIETVESTPDTVISLLNGHKYLVRETADQVRKAILAYRQEIYYSPWVSS
ncbi:MAG: flagellar FlbD family protein [bacterium]